MAIIKKKWFDIDRRGCSVVIWFWPMLLPSWCLWHLKHQWLPSWSWHSMNRNNLHQIEVSTAVAMVTKDTHSCQKMMSASHEWMHLNCCDLLIHLTLYLTRDPFWIDWEISDQSMFYTVSHNKWHSFYHCNNFVYCRPIFLLIHDLLFLPISTIECRVS